MRDKLRRAISAFLPEGGILTCAVSGGADSVAMLHALHTLSGELGLDLRAAHFNHLLRGAESDEDEAFVRALCQDWGIPLTCARGDAAGQADSSSDSLEEAARRLRYRFFETLPGPVATAHTADDNLETLLINLLRGTSLAGLGGIPPMRGKFLRPMLAVTHQQALDYLASQGIPHREDRSNADPAFLRNRLRTQVTPMLVRENPQLLGNILTMTDRLREDEALLTRLAREALDGARAGNGWSCSALRALPPPLLHRAAILLLSALPDRTAKHVEALCKLICSDHPSAQLSLPGGHAARREYDLLLMEASDAARIPWTALDLAGETRIGACSIVCSRTLEPLPGALLLPDCPALFVRSRLPGDRIPCSGGSRLLKKLLIDRKVPALKRDAVPVLCTMDGPVAVLGVPGCFPPRPTQGPFLNIFYKETRH